MKFHCKGPIRSKIVINNKKMEEVVNFKYLGCDIINKDQDIQQKISRFNK